MSSVHTRRLDAALLGAREPRLHPLEPQLRAWTQVVARQISSERLHSAIAALPAPRNRLHAPEAMRQADEMILDGFKQAGWVVERQAFSYTNALAYVDYGNFMDQLIHPRLDGANLVAVKEGETSRDAIVVLGHHDTVRDTPGADDNTAAVAALLELARVLEPYRFRHTVVLAATDMEELGLFGSQALVSRLARDRRILGAINYETMAYTASEPNTQSLPPGLGLVYRGQVRRILSRESRGDFTTVIFNGPGMALATSFGTALADLAGSHVPLLLRDPNDLPLIGRLIRRTLPMARNFTRGDQAAFWEEGIPAIQITDTANFRYQHYHLPTDTPDKLDYARLVAIVSATAAVIASVAGLFSSD